jgi:hypothetical protein
MLTANVRKYKSKKLGIFSEFWQNNANLNSENKMHISGEN